MRTETRATTIRLTEFGELDARLDERQVEILAEDHQRAIELLPLGRGQHRLRANHYVGVIALPDLVVRIEPKIDLKCLFYMLGYAHGIAKLSRRSAGYSPASQLVEFLVVLFAEGAEDLLRSGVRHGYLEEQNELCAVRGRFLLQQHLRRPPTRNIVVPCLYEEFTADLPHNQLIRYTLDQLGWVRNTAIRSRVRRLRKEFSFAARREFRPWDLDGFEYDRLSERYQPIHSICRLLLESRGLDQVDGQYPLGTYLIDMNLLFERFVAAWLQAHLKSPWSIRRQASGYLDQDRRVPIRLDLGVDYEDELCLIADTKYKETRIGPSGLGKPSPGDLYQVLAYCRALGIRTAVLLYPDWDGAQFRVTIRDGANVVIADGIDLRGQPDEVEKGMEALANRLMQCARKQRTAPSPAGLHAAG